MWITRLVFLVILVVLAGVVVWAVFFRPPQQVTKEVTKVEVVVVTVEVPKEVTRVVEKVVKETVMVERIVPAPTLPLLKVSASSLVAATNQVTGTGQITATSVVTQGAWTISYFPGSTQEMQGWKFQTPAPKSWPAFPNVPNGSVPALLEYGKTIDEYCQQSQTCDIIVSAMHYRIISGDYNIPEVGEQCSVGNGGIGCAIMLVNVGSVTASFRDQVVDAGWTVTGRFWDGSKMPDTIWAGLSHTGYSMLNLGPSGNQVNPGANCSSPSGCPKVRLTFVVISGNEVLVKGTSVVSR